MQGMSNEGSAIAAERLAARVEREGPVLKLETGGIGVFCPELAGKVDKENSEHLFVVESLADLFRRHERVRWTEVRSLIATRSAELTGADSGGAAVAHAAGVGRTVGASWMPRQPCGR
jgi:hypothetical protein